MSQNERTRERMKKVEHSQLSAKRELLYATIEERADSINCSSQRELQLYNILFEVNLEMAMHLVPYINYLPRALEEAKALLCALFLSVRGESRTCIHIGVTELARVHWHT